MRKLICAGFSEQKDKPCRLKLISWVQNNAETITGYCIMYV